MQKIKWKPHRSRRQHRLWALALSSHLSLSHSALSPNRFIRIMFVEKHFFIHFLCEVWVKHTIKSLLIYNSTRNWDKLIVVWRIIYVPNISYESHFTGIFWTLKYKTKTSWKLSTESMRRWSPLITADHRTTGETVEAYLRSMQDLLLSSDLFDDNAFAEYIIGSPIVRREEHCEWGRDEEDRRQVLHKCPQ